MASSNPVKIPWSASSGRISATSVSRVTRPRSTHCMAAIEVINFVQEAMYITLFILSGSRVARERTPNARAYWNEPEVPSGYVHGVAG